MKNLKRVIAVLLVVFMLVPMLTAWTVVAAGTMAPALHGETSRSSKVLYPGVTSTNIKTSGSSKYDLQSFNVVEFDLSQTDLYVDVTNERDYVSQAKSTLNTVTSFNSSNGMGKTAIAAINGDLWTMTSAHSRVEGSGISYGGYSDAVVTKSMTLPRGYSVYNGEIVCSSQIEEETPYEGDFWSFGVSDGYVPMIGCPELEISVKNNTKNVTVEADGLNRLPANNALVLYSDKGSASTNSLSDAYEVVIDVNYDYTVEHGASITGTVTGIYTALAPASNPSMKANRFILTGRGTALNRMTSFAVGDTVTLGFNVYERYGRNTEGWQNATCAVGGHMPFVVDGVKWETGTTTNYPTTIVGIKNDGNIVFIVNDGRQSSFSTGLDFNDYWDFADDMDLNTAFILDGGGSANLIETTGSGYSVVNSPSDGTARSVVNSVILSAGPRRGAQDSFNVKVPSDNIDLTNLYFADDDAYMLLTNFAETELEKTADGVKMKAKDFLNGPSLSISYGLPNTTSNNSNSVLAGRSYDYVSATAYPYLVLDMAIVSADTSVLQFQSLYHTADSRKGISQTTFVGFNNAYNNLGFNKYIIHTGSNTAFTGRLNTLHLTYLYPANGVTVRDGDYVILRSARLAKTAQEAAAMTANPTTQTVTFNANGGTVDQTTKYAVHGQTYGVMPVPEKAGYDFNGWYTSASGGEKVTEDTNVTTAASRTLYAQWKASESIPETDPVYISFDLNGGTGNEAYYEIEYGQSYEDAVAAINGIGMHDIPIRNGYTFSGWYCEEYDYTLNYSDIFSVNESVIFKATWSPLSGSYQSTTSLNIRSGPDSSYNSVGALNKGDLFDVTDSQGHWGYGKKVGTDILGWSSYNYLNYVFETEYLPGITLTPWNRVAVLNVDLNGGRYDPNAGISHTTKLSNGGSLTTASNNIGFEETTYDNFDIHIYHLNNVPADAVFNNDYIGVIYKDGNPISKSFYMLGDLLDVILRSGVKSGYKPTSLNFMGMTDFTSEELLSDDEKWADKDIFNGSSYSISINWELAEYILTFDLDGGTMPDEYETQYTFIGDAKLTDVIGGFPRPTKAGYDFVGWQLGERTDHFWKDGWGTQPYTFGEDVTFTARWEDATVTENGNVTQENGNYYLEVDGVRQDKGLYNVNGDYYYVKSDGTLARNETVFTYYDRNVLPRAYRKFGDDCKMMKDGWLTVTTEEYGTRKFFFIDGYHAEGITEIDGDYYFFNINNGEMQSNGDFYVSENSYGVAEGPHFFGSDGRMQSNTRAAASAKAELATSDVVEGSGLANYIESTDGLADIAQSRVNTSGIQPSDEEEE